MASNDKQNRPKARLAKGFRDVDANEIRSLKRMLRVIEGVYENYGFEPVEQPFIEYTDALGKFLPDQDRPNEGVFSFQDDDEQWLSLRYDLTAPLARYVAENQQFLPTPFRSYRQGWVFRNEKPGPGRYRQFMQFDADTVGSASPAADAEVCMMAADTMEALGKFLPDQDRPNEGVFSFQDDDEQWLSLRYDLTAPLARYVAENQQFLPTPFRSYRQGWVFRNEKPGPGRFRQFMQFDADTVGSASPAADAEVCMMAADTMEALGIARGQYRINVFNRKIFDGVLEIIGLTGSENSGRRLRVLRAIDKLDRLGIGGVIQLLGNGRKDESGDVTDGAKLDVAAIVTIQELLLDNSKPNDDLIASIDLRLTDSKIGQEGRIELESIWSIAKSAGYSEEQIRIVPSVVRGLEYYTGPVFECELLMETKDEDGKPVRFGSVGGGGRYDDLVARFTGQSVPATGFSMGVSRLYSALKLLGKTQDSETTAPVVVLIMDRDRQGDYQKMVQQLRAADIRAEMYVGTSGMKAQMKYADKRGSPLVVIQGGDEKAKGEVTLKDLALGAKLASGVESREEYASQRLAQVSVPEAELVSEVKKMLARR